MVSKVAVRAEVYAALAEALADPPAWLAQAGPEWPLFEAVARAARDNGSAAARRAIESLAAIQPESLAARRRRYRQLFAGAGSPQLWLYESLHVDGRLLGPATLAVQQVYRAAGLRAEGAELPDHASLELAFLGWLAKQEAADDPARATEWRELVRSFIKQHAGRWLPNLGRALAANGDPVYAPIGQLLTGWLTEMLDYGLQTGKQTIQNPKSKIQNRLPVIPRPQACTLCGFCAQVCPTQALAIRETDVETGLVLTPPACVSCAKCERACNFGALQMAAQPAGLTGPVALRISPRSTCSGCGQPTVSQAELETIAATLGQRPRWLDYCLECRARLMERF